MRVQATAVAFLSTLALTTAGCDKLTSKTSAVSIITDTPTIDQNTWGWNSTLMGLVPATAFPKATAALVGVAQRDTIASTPKPVTGATASIAYADAHGANQTVSLCESSQGAAGTYEATSLAGGPCASTTFAYVAGSTYKTTIQTASDSYTLSVPAPEPLDASLVTLQGMVAADLPQQVTQDGPVYQHAKGQPLTVSWTLPAGDEGKNVFLAIVRVNFASTADMTRYQDLTDASNWTADPTLPVWSNVPKTPGDMMDLVTGTPTPTATVPESAFQQQGLYLLVVTLANLSDQTTGLSIASGALAGAPTGFLFVVQ